MLGSCHHTLTNFRWSAHESAKLLFTFDARSKKVSPEIKQEEEASQWSGIPVEQLLNSIQSLQ